jgi:hypothetical protein
VSKRGDAFATTYDFATGLTILRWQRNFAEAGEAEFLAKRLQNGGLLGTQRGVARDLQVNPVVQ